MIIYDRIMVRFGELSTKGKNKKTFINVLYKNIKHALKDYKQLEYELRFDHIYVILNGVDYKEIIDKLSCVSGIHALSLVYKCQKDIDEIVSSSFELISKEKGETFKIKCKRSDKSFPFTSDEIIRKVASKVLKNLPLKVDVHQPQILLSIEVRQEGVYISSLTFPGSGGYPLGVGGKAMHMLSGGIDSPVAMYLMMKRGVLIECIHFASPPYTQQAVIYKLLDILKVMNTYQSRIRLNIIPFTKIQEAIYDNAPESYCITIMRRMMYRLASELAKRRNCSVISSGESIGQVASQTLQSIKVINEVTSTPVIRPLATFDKLDIIEISKKINTYDISIRPYEDCCTIFTPKAPKTMPRLEEAKEYEERFDYQSLINEALDNIEVKIIDDEESVEELFE